MIIKKIPQAELEVMKFIWRVDVTVTSKDVIEAMEQKYGWKQTTTLTLLSRLVKRGFLDAQKIDRYTHYTIVVKHKDYLSFETKYFLNKIHHDSLKNLISALHDGENIDKDTLDFLESYFDNLKDE
ncbi:BlaI/MecI/CopY family transcriptional regulator [Clostridioides difficile]|uniref:BlaI/MecI/CopY family transcriptional regulator n=1 Tax=Clostridioides difficile TaxID=1496 RepID=UPI000939934D|nr:BlaI/MecI/CopY family transcriptional regulator [Clostridioides difficile]AXU72453.1 beta-lactamase repressor [Clostridioides difficile]EJA6848258.1 BlaI/MecI/CopY family transcriptional regulator [Clostridioides difficile]ELX4589062.1 BlaI/MecI/CopY family transcriptional regulator [Clostridioides difficile]MBG0257740.1 BlaI/MecI/CopY family transcriptional regulator [Clostridioides difficile]MBH7525876.1 BlaI/MecI/CopY family transcriptional regulator [Clostridioides difficile]